MQHVFGLRVSLWRKTASFEVVVIKSQLRVEAVAL